MGIKRTNGIINLKSNLFEIISEVVIYNISKTKDMRIDIFINSPQID